MITYTTAETEADLLQILALQKRNLAVSLNKAETESQGFVTVEHTYSLLQNLHKQEKQVVAKENNQVIGYLLAMTPVSKSTIPVLVPMFDEFDSIDFAGKKVSTFRYLVVGQVCIDKAYRGMGVLDNMYAAYRRFFVPKYDFAITEIAANNTRSLRAHQRVGFAELHRYTGTDNIPWVVVVWDWQNR